MPCGPRDGILDGHINNLTGKSLTDNVFRYGVDYLGYWLAEAARHFKDANGIELPDVDIVCHSTGGPVTRTYIESGAYGGEFVDLSRGLMHLPRVHDLVMVGVPNRGASKAWNPLHDNFAI